MKKKKLFKMAALLLGGTVAGFLIWNAVFALTGFSIFGGSPREHSHEDSTQNAALATLAYSVLEYIRDDDFTALSSVVHPELGVVFSPYTTIDLSTDRQFSVSQIAALGSDNTRYIWGVHNGTGEPIEMTPAEYIEVYIPAETYIEASIVGINQVIRSGNALENIKVVFPDVRFVDFHLPGEESDTQSDNTWSSLRLGFEEYDGSLWLIAIVHSQWTA